MAESNFSPSASPVPPYLKHMAILFFTPWNEHLSNPASDTNMKNIDFHYSITKTFL